ncbi:MAG: radical SAM protein [candidate division WOR-3 bacterium]
MRVLGYSGRDDIARVYVADINGKCIEFVEAFGKGGLKEKWVIIVSTLFGCPVKCKMCDACGSYSGKMSADEIIKQIDFLVALRFKDRHVDVKKWKIQFARMGEPAFNDAVLDVLLELVKRYNCENIIPSISTIAPAGRNAFFDRLLKIKKDLYKNSFQLQFSIHTTDENFRNWLIPVKKLGFKEIALYGKEFYDPEGKKVTLNFAVSSKIPVDVKIIEKHFSPDAFLIKLTPVNPSLNAVANNLPDPDFEKLYDLATRFREVGFEVIVSIGELEENKIGSNCGLYINAIKNHNSSVIESYQYPILKFD